jgi:hypothetical protein
MFQNAVGKISWSAKILIEIEMCDMSFYMAGSSASLMGCREPGAMDRSSMGFEQEEIFA